MGGLLIAQDAPKADAKPENSMTYITDVAKADASAGTFVNPDDPQVAPLAQYGAKVIERVGGALVMEINRELALKTVAESIDAMHLKKFELPKSKPGEPAVIAVKRTSAMLRDMGNAPDAADQAALDRIHVQLMNGESPDKLIVQKLEHKDKPVEWRVYRPIATTQSCLACHGNPAQFAPNVREILEKRYPGDKAVDYQKQEFRGVLRVSLNAPDAAK